MCAQLKEQIDPEEDSIVIYTQNISPDFEKKGIGQTINNEDFIL